MEKHLFRLQNPDIEMCFPVALILKPGIEEE